jgi:hypothetical protein
MEAISSPFLENVFLDNSAVTPVIHSRTDNDAEELLDKTVAAAVATLGGNPHLDLVALTSQTGFDFYKNLPHLIRMKLQQAGLTFNEMVEEQSFSNSQPFIGDVAERVDRDGVRALVLALEPLNLWPRTLQREQLRKGLLDRPEREHLPSMIQGLSELIEAFCSRFKIPSTALSEIKEQLTVTLHEHKSRNPDPQFSGTLNLDTYRSAAPLAGHLTKWDCCPPTTQGAALLLSPRERLSSPESAVRFRATTTHNDPRSIKERFAFPDYPHNEALYSASNELFDHPVMEQLGLTRSRFLDRGILELHNAVSPLVILLLIEMGFVPLEEAMSIFDKIDMDRINPSGGLFASHPLAATFPIIAHHSRLQLLNQAPEALQLSDIEYALIQSIYGLRDRLSLTLLSRE